MRQPSPEVIQVMRQHGVPPQCIGCLVMQTRAHLWIAMDAMDQAYGPDPDPQTAAVKPTTEEHMREYPVGCPGPIKGQCQSPQFLATKP